MKLARTAKTAYCMLPDDSNPNKCRATKSGGGGVVPLGALGFYNACFYSTGELNDYMFSLYQ